MRKFIDSHSHSIDSLDTLRVQNVFAQQLADFTFKQDQLYSVGIHPWHVDKINEDVFLQMDTYIYRYPNILAIGEIGLDRRCGVDFKKQQLVFDRQIQIAMKHIKPVILHSVKTSSDILFFLKRHDFKFLVHGFNDSFKIANDFIDRGGYLSIGKAILNPMSKIRTYIVSLPISRILVESDDETEIATIYSELALLLKINVDELLDNINLNFTRFYGLVLHK